LNFHASRDMILGVNKQIISPNIALITKNSSKT